MIKRVILAILLISSTIYVSAIDGFGIDGNLGAGLNGSEMVYNPSIDGRMQFNEIFSASIGLGLLNSGVKNEWTDETESSTTFISYRLSSNSTTPTLNLSFRGQIRLFEVLGHKLSLYAEPKLIYIPFSGRQLDLYEFNINREVDAITGEITYSEVGDPEHNFITSPSQQNLYGSISGGISIEIKKNVELSLGYGYTNIDVFKYVRDKSINGSALMNHLPGHGIQYLNIGIRVNYTL